MGDRPGSVAVSQRIMTSMKGEVSVATPLREPTPKVGPSPLVVSSSNNMPSQTVNTPSPPSSSTSSPSSLSSISTPDKNPQQIKKTPKDFIFGKFLGEGSFSTVYLAKDIHTNKEYAIKVCDKRHILREKKQAYVKREKEVLNILNNHPSPFFVKLYCTFQDADRLYFVLTYAKSGELLSHINKVGSLDEICTRFYAAEIVLALEHLHRLDIIHRDLKPENILLSEQMHILVTDFGSAKILHDTADGEEASGTHRKNSFVGTAQYVSPELLTDKCASKSSDLWALGCILYQMVSGLPPFRAPNEYLIFQKIIKLEYDFPEGFYANARNLVEKLVVLDPLQRLGATDRMGYPSIKAHHFFKGLNFEDLCRQTPPVMYPYLPSTPGNEDLRSPYRVPDTIRPGLDDKDVTRLLGLDLHADDKNTMVKIVADGNAPEIEKQPVRKMSTRKISVIEFSNEDRLKRIAIQAKENQWHRFVSGNVILKQGLIDKRKGLFAKRRMLLLTTGPHLYYVDPVNQVLKGEIPWSPELRPEARTFKTFFVHTPNRIYYLEDPEGYALEWCRMIEEVHKQAYQRQS